MVSPQFRARPVALIAGVGITALFTAAATALPAAADSPGNNGNASHGNSSSRDTGHNPPGNNGTVFIHDVADDHSPHNVPHVSCNFWVDLFNFDNSQSVTVSFAGQAPTGKGTALGGETTTTLEADDASGAGNDWDGELAFTADQLGVSNLGAPAHEGYHVKMTVVTNQPGDHKYKVFWIQPCESATPTQPTTVAGESTSTGQSPATGQSTATETSSSTGQSTATGKSTSAGKATSGAIAPQAAAQANSGTPTEVLGTKFTRGGATPASAATASSLPFTGAEIGTMALAAAVALGGGVLLLVAGRRRRRLSSE
jgi:hypothetical protein